MNEHMNGSMGGWMNKEIDGGTDDKHKLTDKQFGNNRPLLICTNVFY